MNESIGTIIMRLRKEHGMTQEQLANALGITFQAVSKWENGMSSPDLSTLPLLADLFGVSVDALLGREALPQTEERMTAFVPAEEVVIVMPEQAEEPEKTEEAEAEPFYSAPGQDLPWPDDDSFYAVLFHGHELVGYLRGDDQLAEEKKQFLLRIQGKAKNIVSDFSVQVDGDVAGDISAGQAVSCEDVGGSVRAGTGLECGDIGGDAFAGGGIECGDVDGNLTAGVSVNCGNVEGNVKAGGNVQAGDVDGSVSAGGNVECGDVDGNVSAGVSVNCDQVEGKVHTGFGKGRSKNFDLENFDRELNEYIDREIEHATEFADREADFGDSLSRRINEAVQRAVEFGMRFGKKTDSDEE